MVTYRWGIINFHYSTFLLKFHQSSIYLFLAVSVTQSTNACIFNLFSFFLVLITPYLYEKDFMQGILKKKEMKLTWSFNFMFCHVEDIILLKLNSKFCDYVVRIYPIYPLKRTPQIQIDLLHTLTYTYKLTVRTVSERTLQQEIISIFPL